VLLSDVLELSIDSIFKGIFIHLPLKMEPIESSETSANNTQTPGTYPKESKLHLLLVFRTYSQKIVNFIFRLLLKMNVRHVFLAL
jgi:hypothetical protein